MLIVLVGESGSGKTTIETELCKLGAKKAVSYTSRECRQGEIYGKDYYFTSKEYMEKMIKDNELIEYTYYNNNYYGTPFKELQEADVTVIEPNGLRQLREKGIYICAFYLEVSEEERIKRMLKRGDSIEKIEERLKNDKKTFKGIKKDVDVIVHEHLTIEESVNVVLKMSILHRLTGNKESMANLLFTEKKIGIPLASTHGKFQKNFIDNI